MLFVRIGLWCSITDLLKVYRDLDCLVLPTKGVKVKAFIQMLIGPSGLILLGAFLSAIGALWASHQQTDFQIALNNKNEEIISLQGKILDSVMGGDSFCYLALSNLNSVNNSGIIVFVHQGDDPIYDVQARIVDLQEVEKLKGAQDQKALTKSDRIINVGDIAPNMSSMFDPISLGQGDRRDFNIFFTAKNGGYIQRLRLRKVNGVWTHATLVKRDNKIIFEKIHKDYPRNKDGEIDW